MSVRDLETAAVSLRATARPEERAQEGAASRAAVLIERCLAASALAALSAPLACALLVVRVLSRRPPLVAHRRVGLNGEMLWVLKIRTMWDRTRNEKRAAAKKGPSRWIEYLPDAEAPVIKRGPDPRVTSRFARFCRRFSIDELPQLAHVASGKMRFAGPRPLTQIELEVHYREAAEEILSVRPGITGLWQVMGRNNLTYPQRRRLDRFFVRRLNWRLYWWVLLRTPGCVISGRGVW